MKKLIKLWIFFREGILDFECEAKINHAVLAIGYGYDKVLQK